MLHSKTFKDYLQEYALIVVGSVIYAAGFRFFYYPTTSSPAASPVSR